MSRSAGIDVGGTKALGVVIDDGGQVVQRLKWSTPAGSDAVIDRLAELAGALAPYDSLGVGVPGLVTRDGVLRAAPNLVDVVELAVAPRLSERLGHPVTVQNDATCALVAEWRHGVAREVDDVVLVTLGTGIGGGVVAGGQLQVGANGFAGELGHMVLDPDGPLCVCGRRGCWERFASGSALAQQARQAAREGRLDAVLRAVGDVEAIVGEDVQRAASAGDEQALDVVDGFARWVALGLVNLTNALDPAMFVLGGGLATAPALYLAPIQRWLAALLYSPEHRPHPRLAFARWGEEAGAVGAARYAQERAAAASAS